MDAGPSDYWKRSPSPSSPAGPAPINWRMPSDTPFNADDIDKGPSDHYGHSPAQLHPPDTLTPMQDKTNDGLLQNVLDDTSSPTQSRSPSLVDRFPHHGYHRTFHDIIGEKDIEVDGSSIGDEELGRIRTHRDDYSDRTPSLTSNNLKKKPFIPSPSPNKRASFIHPSISRLRSHMRTTSGSTQQTPQQPHLSHLRASSHFSQISEAKSETLSIDSGPPQQLSESSSKSPAFVFHPLRRLSVDLFSRDEAPAVMDVRGMIAIGTDKGRVLVYGFDQQLKHILGSPVTAITISSDQTYVAVGRSSGNIHLYDLSNPSKPARTTLALTLSQVLSGRREGHIQNSSILHIGFVGARHTSVISGDEHGRAFWWSLGRVIGVESNDVVRMLGSYPNADGQSRKPTTLFAALPLPLGENPHPVDSLNLSALLTPAKMVIVGMKPSPKTWYRKMRDNIGGEQGGLIGCALWSRSTTEPTLAYSWGRAVRLLHVHGKDPQFEEGKTYEATEPVRSMQWYDDNHLLVLSSTQLVLLNVISMVPVEMTMLQTRLLTSQDSYSSLTRPSSTQTLNSLAGSTKTTLQVGTLQHWNDRILAHVHQGDFLGAIQTALEYYEDRADGNKINLPEDTDARKAVISNRLHELLLASLRWAFSPDRLTEDTHLGQGIDLTSLFEGLATAAIEACLSMKDITFLFDEAYEHFAQAGIQSIFLRLLEPHILSGRIRQIPPSIFQALIKSHEEKGQLDQAEAIIWNVDPISLDINQAITLCEAHGLWDAMIYVYTRAMQDYVAPLVKLINVVRDIQQDRLNRPSLVGDTADGLERWAPNAYKLYAYVESVLSGLSYPSGDPLPEGQAYTARTDVYSFIFAGRTISWPTKTDLILTGEGPEPPYPYLNLLLRFDTEAFLHSMDIAFEDSYLNDTSGAINRQSIVNLMLDVMDPEYFHPGDITFLHIFVARNLPKYPQFLFIPPSTLHRILVSLASDPDQSTREDRQLAAEYLLSAYTPHDSDAMMDLFNQAGFYRILRTSYRQQHKWGKLISTLLRDPESDDQVFASLDEIITSSSPSDEVFEAVSGALPQLLALGVRQTASLLDRDLPSCHPRAIEVLTTAPHKQMAYLRCLLEPEGETRSDHIDMPLRHLYTTLLCQNDPDHLVPFLDSQDPTSFDLANLAMECENLQVFEGQLWALDRQGRTADTFGAVGDILRSRGVDLGEAILADDLGTIHMSVSTIQSVSRMATRLCQEHSSTHAAVGDVEDLWLGVLHEVIELVHSISALQPMQPTTAAHAAVSALRSIVQETLASLVASSSPSLSFPRLFKRLVDASTSGTKQQIKKGRTYAEFRIILTGMLDSYRAEGEMLSMTTKLVEADLFEILSNLKVKRESGWMPGSFVCEKCGKIVDGGTVVVRADGITMHRACVDMS
ncbi:hypothetical protein I302_101013 [Kwoniella bestiolae CBS 10118]|uniref:Vacuolar protein sorting-associated protein 8 central domain-containing protein n=1 Tax=Kwoniella bestiolae CBS 10118 TaxID=1296100 RepID=A0AAJ8M5Z5_9TREE